MRQERRHRPWAGLMNWKSAIAAIMVREVRTRFSGGSLGYAWAIILPVTWVMAIVIFFVWIGRSAPVAVPLPMFIASGMVPYLIFRQVVTSMMRVVRANRHLITMGPVAEEDLFTAGALLELLNVIIVCGAILTILFIVSGPITPPNALQAVMGILLAWALGVSGGRFAASVSHYSDTAQRLVPILLRPFFWISGIFFVASELPRTAQEVLWYNPLLHIIETLRAGFLPGFESQFTQPIVPIVAICVLYFTSRALDSARAIRPLEATAL